eukprot:6510958-Prymnesium_polylepis.2
MPPSRGGGAREIVSRRFLAWCDVRVWTSATACWRSPSSRCSHARWVLAQLLDASAARAPRRLAARPSRVSWVFGTVHVAACKE